jgi:hypothetical protein
MPPTPPDAKLCPACGTRKSGVYPGGLCRRCYDLKREGKPPLTPAKFEELQAKLKEAQASGDWKALAEEIHPTYVAVAAGTVKATAAQVSVMNHIMDRAYGKVSKTQEDKRGPVGVIVLPTMGLNKGSQVCPACIEAHKLHE